MVAQAKIRASGQTVAEEVAPNSTDDFDKPLESKEPKPINLTRAFSRMRTDWHSPDLDTIRSVKDAITQIIFEEFQDAYALMYEIFDTVREQDINKDTGEVKVDVYGLPEWKQKPDGSYVEDWDRIKKRDRDRFIHIIVTRLFDWEQKAADMWGEALFAKARLDEAFATGFDEISDPKATVNAREARANRLSSDHRYLAVYKSLLSKKAESVVKSMDRIQMRLKDLSLN